MPLSDIALDVTQLGAVSTAFGMVQVDLKDPKDILAKHAALLKWCCRCMYQQ
jgi:hypothetical protein